MTQTKFTVDEFFKAVEEDSFGEKVTIDGMTKQDDTNNDVILFTVGRGCEDWIVIPKALIEQIEYLETVPCKDHKHPFVRIYFVPLKGNPEAELFANLLSIFRKRLQSQKYSQPDLAIPKTILSSSLEVARPEPLNIRQHRLQTRAGIDKSRATFLDNCCDVSITAHCENGSFSRGEAFGQAGFYGDCDDCLDEAYRSAAASCGGTDRVLSHREFGGSVSGENCPHSC